MTLNENDCSRIVSVVHNLKKQLKHLSYSQQQVFSVPFSLQKAQSLLIDEVLAEKVEAFTSRFCRFQDTIGDKLLPLWLKALGETISANIDNLDKAEKLGVLESADRWFEIRQLHNRMVHEYVDDIQLLTSALQTANESVDMLVNTMNKIIVDLEKRDMLSDDLSFKVQKYSQNPVE